jgi:hypothetical protein
MMLRTMCAWVIVFSVMCVSVWAEDAVPPKTHPDSSQWKDLFTPDLSNAIYPKGIWFFTKDRELTATEDQNIWTKEKYSDAIIDVEFKTGDNANSGLFVFGDGDLTNWSNSLEIQILDDYGVKWRTADKSWQCGALFGRLAPTKRTVKHAGEWNRLTVTCLGKKIYVLLNGEQINEFDMTKWTSAKKNPDGTEIPAWLVNPNRPVADMPTSGHVGLQGKHGGAPIYFRNMKIKPLTP